MLRSFMDVINTALLIAVILAAASMGVATLALILVARRAWRQFRARRFAAFPANLPNE